MQELLETMPELQEDERTITATRLFRAPRPLVYQAFADPAQVIHWWGPHGFTLTIHEMDLRPGGKWRLIMHAPDGTNYPNEIVFTAVVPFERVEQDLFGSKHGAAHLHLHQTITWEDEAGGTRLTIRSRFETRELRDNNVRTYGAVQGVRDLFERLERHLSEAAPTELHLKRIFKAPLPMVFDAWANPEILAQWWGPKNFTSTVHQWETRPGGEILVVMHAPNGVDYPMGGRFLDFHPPYNFRFLASALDGDGNPLFENWNSVTFEEVEGGTQITLDVHVRSMTDEAPQYLKGMKQGWSMSLDKLDDLLTRS